MNGSERDSRSSRSIVPAIAPPICMTSLIRFFQFSLIPTSADIGLLLLRFWIGGSMLVLHGWQKLTHFSELTATFPDPLGVGSMWSLILALCGEVLCQILIMLGFVTRLAALGAATTMGVAWYAVHKMALTGGQSGELAFIYLAGYVALVFAGAGRYSLDGTGGAGGGSSRIKPQAPKK